MAAPARADAPGNAEVLTLIGHLHRATGTLEQAAALYERALRLDPGSTTACIYLADCRAGWATPRPRVACSAACPPRPAGRWRTSHRGRPRAGAR